VTNEAMRATWATGAAGWVDQERVFDAVLAPFTSAVLDAAQLRHARRMLDVGCGSGTLLAAGVAAGVEPVGVDISPVMVDAARRRVPAATVIEADAQTADLTAVAPGPPFDRVVSRFGVMFFDNPQAAFRNLRAAAAPGARLAFVCWREEQSAMFTHGLAPLADRVDRPPTPPAVGDPGPLGLADPHRTRALLAAAGWSDITLDAVDGPCDFSVDGSDGVEERLAMALNGTIGRTLRAELEPQLGPAGWADLLDEARAGLRAALVDGAVRFAGHAWVVTAGNPALEWINPVA
jgi:SAM-dependent methyltransferase